MRTSWDECGWETSSALPASVISKVNNILETLSCLLTTTKRVINCKVEVFHHFFKKFQLFNFKFFLNKRGEKEFENVRYDENCCYNSIVRIIYFLWEVAWLFKRMFRSKKIHNKIIVFFSWTQFFCWISSTSSKCTRSMVQWLIWPANHRQYLTS